MIKISRLFLVCWFSFLANTVAAAQATVAVASNFAPAMSQIVAEFERQTDHRLRLVTGSSGKLYSQIRHGAPFDALFSADQKIPALLAASELAVADSRFTYAVGALVLWSAKGGVASPKDALLQQRFAKLALANPRVAPYGAAAVEVLQQLGLAEITQAKWVQGENIAQTYHFVASGNADLGFVALAQVIAAGTAPSTTWHVPEHYHRPIKQDAILLRTGQDNRAATEFMQFMRSEKASVVLQAFGYSADRVE